MPWSRYTHKRNPLTKDESNRIVNACKTLKEKIVIWGILDSGLRISELINLKVNDIDWQGRRLTVYGKGMGKIDSKGRGRGEKKRRTVPMSNRFKALLEHHYATADTSEDTGPHATLGSTLGLNTVRGAELLVKRVANKAMIGKSCCPHVLRHTFAVMSLENGVSLAALQQVMGHEDLATTAIYLNLSGDEAIRNYQDKGY